MALVLGDLSNARTVMVWITSSQLVQTLAARGRLHFRMQRAACISVCRAEEEAIHRAVCCQNRSHDLSGSTVHIRPLHCSEELHLEYVVTAV